MTVIPTPVSQYPARDQYQQDQDQVWFGWRGFDFGIPITEYQVCDNIIYTDLQNQQAAKLNCLLVK